MGSFEVKRALPGVVHLGIAKHQVAGEVLPVALGKIAKTSFGVHGHFAPVQIFQRPPIRGFTAYRTQGSRQ